MSRVRSSLVLVAVAPSVALVGCQGPQEASGASMGTAGTSASASSSAEATGSTGASIVGSAGCGMPALSPGTHQALAIEFSGMTRSYDLFVPQAYEPQRPMPLVLGFHGHLGSPSSAASGSMLDPMAQTRGFIAAYPQGLGASWNGGQCCGPAYVYDEDDVGFAVAVVEQVSAQLCVDPGRVYATGISNGAFLVQRIACEAAEHFTAVASVAGVLGIPAADCTPSTPIAVWHVHGTADQFVPYEGNGPGYPPVPEMMEGWAARNGCDRDPTTVLQRDEVQCDSWPGCTDAVEVTLCTVQGGGHCWPGHDACPEGQDTTGLVASEAIVEFFEAHVRR
ncbi:MAG: prolyl oligopeptidase family serine peptidase [Deltaproteobacteria bacterium]|nr:prolyl oligopeptidase family serine peptidase [Deltaproteobacteria bacterium]